MKLKLKLFTSLLASVLILPFMVNTADAATTEFSLKSEVKNVNVGQTFEITMSGKNVKDLYAYEAKFNYDPTQLEVVTAKSKMAGFSVSPIKKDKEITIAHTKIGDVKGQDGNFDIGTVSFKAKKAGSFKITWTAMKSVDHDLKSQSTNVNKSITVTAAGTAPGLKDIKGHWAEQQIKEAVEKGIVDGYPDGTFRPNASITRAEFSAILARALKLQDTKALQFADLAKIPEWARPAIGQAVKAGIITGYDDNTFRATKSITRAEIAAMAARGLKISAATGNKLSFADKASIPTWAKGWIEAAVNKGLVKGRDGNKFAPMAGATRAEATVIVLRMLDVK